MTSNVGRLLRRPCALSQRSLPLPRTTTKRYIEYQSPRETLDDETANKILRASDQSALKKTNQAAAKFVTSINNLQKAIDIIPTTITNPSIEGEYTIGSIRGKAEDTTIAAQAVINAVEQVQADLKDLRVQGYGKKKDAKDLVSEFEEEIEDWSEEKKQEELKNWQFEELGRITRLNEASQLLIAFVNEKLRAKPKAKVPDFDVARGSAVEPPVEKRDRTRTSWPEPDPEHEHEPAEVKPVAPATPKTAPNQRDLSDLQSLLEENVVGSSGKK